MPIWGFSGGRWLGHWPAAFFMDTPAIQNLDWLRKLIKESQPEVDASDLVKLRMISVDGAGTAGITKKQVDR